VEISSKNDSIKNRFFELTNYFELKNFEKLLDRADPFSNAMSYLCRSCMQKLDHEGEKNFNPAQFLSDDMSAAIIGKWPVVFMGTNSWAMKPYMDLDVHLVKMNQIYNRINEIRLLFPDKDISCVIVPEKDYVLDTHFNNDYKFKEIDELILTLDKFCVNIGINFHFSDYLISLKKYEKKEDFEYPDTHLPARHYVQIYSKILKGIGINWPDISSNFTMKDLTVYGDLLTKFTSLDFGPRVTKSPSVNNENLAVQAGTATFGDPLGSTWQSIKNFNPLISGKVLILGDSHSSILDQHRLTYLFAATFETCDFFWNPLGIRGNIEETDADYIVIEISQRFLL
jgi:hypothetical protein